MDLPAAPRDGIRVPLFHRGRMVVAARAPLAALLVVATLAPIAHEAGAAPKKNPTARPARVTLHQFSGVVTSIDKTSLTVEKQGRSPRTMQFVRDEKMTMQGEVEAQSHVTVYYRD